MYNNIISIENLLEAWKEFLRGKRSKKDVQEFQYKLSDNIFSLYLDLKNKIYKHGGYYAFDISDPKPRNIHKASVKDRLLHHAIYRQLYSFFDQSNELCRVVNFPPLLALIPPLWIGMMIVVPFSND